MRGRPASLAATAALLLVGGIGGPAAAQDRATDLDRVDGIVEEFGWEDPDGVTGEALELLFLEIALLTELDAFAGAPAPELAKIHDAYSPWPPAEPNRQAAITVLFAVDGRLAGLKPGLVDLGAAPFVAPAIDELGIETRPALGRREQGLVDPKPYSVAVSVLITRGTADRLAAEGLLGTEFDRVLDEALRDHSAPVVADLLGADDEALPGLLAELGADDESGRTWLVLALATTSVGSAGAAVYLRRRRRPDGPDAALTARVMDAQRRLTEPHDENGIAAIAVTAATDLTDAESGLLVRRSEGGLRVAGCRTVIAASALDRVVQTGQPLVVVTDLDPAHNGPAAMAAVPLVAGGEITGVLSVARSPERPFDHETRRRLEMLAPSVAGALTSADQLGNLAEQALVDKLTDLANRRRLDGDLETTLAEAVQAGTPVAFAMIDVDHFKQFNDYNGHEAGDEALRAVARAIEATVRGTDVVYRYGGEEFCVLLPGATDAEAELAAERIRLAVQATPVPGEASQPGGSLTVSVGVSSLATGAAHDLTRRADAALYEAKARGRNRSVVG